MALDTAGRRKRRLSMTSLIDVIFLLLLFFMLTSTFSKYGEVRLTSAGQGRGTGAAQSEIYPVFIRLSEEDVSLDGRPVEFENLGETLVATGLDGANPHIMISPQEDVSAQRLVDLLALLGKRNWPITVLQ